MSRLHALHKTIEFHGEIESQPRGEAGAHPERIDRFDKHSAGADVACASTKHRRAPFDLEVGTERVARRLSAFESSSGIIPNAHESGAPPCQGFRTTPPRRNPRLPPST